MKRFVVAVSVLLSVACGVCRGSKSAKVWEFRKESGDWHNTRGLKSVVGENGLILDVEQKDSNIENPQASLDGANYNYVHIRYRATGFATPTTGQIFYANAHHGYTEKYCWILPSLSCDDKWHELLLDKSCFKGHFCDWENSKITRLRLDLVDQAPGRIELKYLALSKDGRLSLPGYKPRAFWSFSEDNGLKGWFLPRSMAVSLQRGAMVLDIEKRLSYVLNCNISSKAGNNRFLFIRYRAENLPPKISGQIFYSTPKHSFVERFCWHVPPLNGDGKWHILILDGEKACGNFNDWRQGPIRAVRLHLVHQDRGRIEISALGFFGRESIRKITDVRCEAKRKWLFPVPEGKGEFVREAILPKGEYDVWARILAVPEARKNLPQLRFKQMTPVKETWPDRGVYAWVKVATGKGGRFAFTAGETLRSYLDCLLVAEKGFAVSDMPSEPPPKPVSEVVPVKNENVVLRKFRFAPYWAGRMIYDRSDRGNKAVNTTYMVTYLRRRFKVPDNMTSAYIQISVDDFYRLYLNGSLVGAVLKDEEGTWTTPKLYDVTDKLFPGENVIAIESINVGGPGGALFDLTVNLKKGKHFKMVSDNLSRCLDRRQKGWEKPDFDDSTWRAPVCKAPPPAAPWTRELPYVDKTVRTKVKCLEVLHPGEILPEDSFRMKLKLKPETNFGESDALRLTLSYKGFDFLDEEYPFNKETWQRLNDDTWVITVNTGKVFRYCAAENLKGHFSIYGRRLVDGKGGEISFRLRREASVSKNKNVTSKIVMKDGWPLLQVKGRPLYMLVYNSFQEENYRDWPTKSGANVYTVWAGDRYEGFWQKGGKYAYAYAKVDKQVEKILTENPDVMLLPCLWVNPPRQFWGTHHSSERSLFNDGTGWDYYQFTASFASQKWRKEAAKAARSLVRHMENAPYGDRIIGYNLMAGVSAEWQGWGCHSCHSVGKLMDYSIPAKKGFAEFLRRKYQGTGLDTGSISIPSYAERLRKDDGVFRDPVKSRFCIDYDEFYSKSVADTINAVAGAVKDETAGKKLVGAYFGYTLEFSNMNWAWHMSGHNALREVRLWR